MFTETEAGTPQGGIASPLLANIALHGLEAHIRSQFPEQMRLEAEKASPLANWKPQVIRYADDLVILHRDKAVIETCQHLTEEWLQRMGLELHPKKTRMAHTLLDEAGTAGFNFLGFSIRQYRVSQCNTGTGRGFKTLIKPSADAIKRHDKELAECIRRNQAATQEHLIGLLNPKIAGWSNYYRAVVSKKVFQKLDHQLYVKLAKWARYRHPRKSHYWISRRYWDIAPGQGWISGALAPSSASRCATRGRRADASGSAAAARGEKRGFGTPIRSDDCKTQDVNKDGMPDLVCKFDFQASTPRTLGMQKAALTGTTSDDYDFHGSDTIRFVP